MTKGLCIYSRPIGLLLIKKHSREYNSHYQRRRDDDDNDSDEGEEIRCKREAPEHDGTEEGHKAWWVQHAAWITTEGYDDEILGGVDETKYPRRVLFGARSCSGFHTNLSQGSAIQLAAFGAATSQTCFAAPGHLAAGLVNKMR